MTVGVGLVGVTLVVTLAGAAYFLWAAWKVQQMYEQGDFE